ncbi:hypothetical protein THAOC_21406 [Thalassiosira oceanica]|uniref:Uncharacterized protein n=1 Tax=Thalassiosira oceanica TaxID=159749 RepID=K0RZG8_THAOC|nr:hypothetical protein THAOC_21406 [Thalassiosira oceanica]|eukprot:EJK58465.1 hypothetical protein THAOC_21406 [Thalassiosira oceanica]
MTPSFPSALHRGAARRKDEVNTKERDRSSPRGAFEGKASPSAPPPSARNWTKVARALQLALDRRSSAGLWRGRVEVKRRTAAADGSREIFAAGRNPATTRDTLARRGEARPAPIRSTECNENEGVRRGAARRGRMTLRPGRQRPSSALPPFMRCCLTKLLARLATSSSSMPAYGLLRCGGWVGTDESDRPSSGLAGRASRRAGLA